MERRALQKLDREHRLERARLGRLQSSSTIVAEGELPPDAAYEARIGDADRAAARDAARERWQDLEAQRRQMPQADAGPRPRPRPRRGLRALIFPPTLSPPVAHVVRSGRFVGHVRKGEPPRRTAGDGPLTALRAPRRRLRASRGREKARGGGVSPLWKATDSVACRSRFSSS